MPGTWPHPPALSRVEGVYTPIKEMAMKKLILALCVLGVMCSARGVSAGETDEKSVTFEFLMTSETLCLNDDYYFEVRPGDSIAFTWTAREPAPEVVTTDANHDRYPLFGGTGIYTVPGLYTIPTDVPEGTYYLTRIGGPVRGTVNVRRG